MSQCAACGKSDESLKTCAACKMVKYCGRTCQVNHRPKHKHECKKRASELFDEGLFKELPPQDDCPICFLPLPRFDHLTTYQPCCGKIICCGCANSLPIVVSIWNFVCPFCRAPAAHDEQERIERLKKRMAVNDPEAFLVMAKYYICCFRKDRKDPFKAREMWLKAIELGSSAAHHDLADAWSCGLFGRIDVKKARYHYEQAAMGGVVEAHHNLGVDEARSYNMRRAVKHFLVASKAGFEDSVLAIKDCYRYGYAKKEEFESALRGFQKYQDETQSEQRKSYQEQVRNIKSCLPQSMHCSKE